MADFSIDGFRGVLAKQGGLAPSNKYRVELPPLNELKKANSTIEENEYVSSFDMNYLCTTTQLPGKQLNVLSREIGIGTKSIANGQVFAPINLTFYLTEEYEIRKYFQYWMECVVSQKVGEPMYAGYYKNYVLPVKMYQMNKGQLADGLKDLYGIELIDAFPTSMEMIQLNNQAQTAPLEMTVSLSYKTYNIL
jgi:hypothetical protein